MADKQRNKRFVCYILVTVLILNILVILNNYNSLCSYKNISSMADFNHYYGTAWLILHRIVPYGIRFDSIPIASQFMWHENIMCATNPPVLGITTTFLALYDKSTAWLLWFSVIIISQLVSLLVLRKEVVSNWPWYVQLLHTVMFFANTSIIDNIYMSQIQSILFMYVLLGWATLRHRDSALGGICWGISIAIKFYTLPLLLLLMATKKTKALSSALLTIIMLSYAAMSILGNNIYLEFFGKGAKIVQDWATKSYYNVSVFGCINSMLSFSSFHNYKHILAIVVMLFTMILILLAIYMLVNSPPSKDKFDWGTLLFMVISFAGTVVSWPSYYLFIIFYVTLIIKYSSISTTSMIISTVVVILTGNIVFGFLNLMLDIKYLFYLVMPLCNLVMILYLYWVSLNRLRFNKLALTEVNEEHP